MRQLNLVNRWKFPLAGALCALASCDTSALSSQPQAVAMPGVRVSLPPAPSFSDLDQPTANPDGTLTVWGLRKQKKNYLTKDVKVKAFLLDVYLCPVCPKGQTCKLCDQPHFFLSDKPDGKKEKALMVVDYLMPKQKPPALTVGKQYTVEGTFARNSPTGFAMSDGLLQFTKMVDDKNVELLSPAALLEAQALKGEALEQEALEKAARMKKKQMK